MNILPAKDVGRVPPISPVVGRVFERLGWQFLTLRRLSRYLEEDRRGDVRLSHNPVKGLLVGHGWSKSLWSGHLWSWCFGCVLMFLAGGRA